MRVAGIGLVQGAQSYFEELTCIWAEVTQVLGQTSVITKATQALQAKGNKSGSNAPMGT